MLQPISCHTLASKKKKKHTTKNIICLICLGNSQQG